MANHIRWNRPWGLVVTTLLLFVAATSAVAQSDMATGTILGTVTDTAGIGMPGVTVTASDGATGFSRSQQSDGEGRFQIRLLPPSTYALKAHLDGFAPYEQLGIRVRVGDIANLRIQMELVTVVEQVTVTGSAPLVETARASTTTTVTAESIDSLPIDGRNFAALVALAPQTTIVIGRPSIAGGEGLNNSFNVDGADNNSTFFGEALGGIQPPFTYSQSSVQEFQVLRASYNVRFGGAAGGIINVVTKSGTNTYHGGAVVSFQNDAMTTTDALGIEQEDFERIQAGFNIGGPIQRDRFRFFIAYEAQRLDANNRGRPVGLTPELEPAFDAKLTSLGIDPETEFNFIFTDDADVLLVRLDWAINDNHLLWFRNNYLDHGGDNSTFSFLTSGRSNRGRNENGFNSSVLTLNSVLGRRSFNEAIVQYVPAKRPNLANYTLHPQTSITFNFQAVVGQSWILPNELDETRLQLQDNFTLQQGRHSLRFGVDYSYLDFDNQFLFNGGGWYIMPSYEEFVREQPCADPFTGCFYQQAFSPVDGKLQFESHLLSLYAGDEWTVNPRLTFEYGLRLDHQDNPSPQNPNPLEPRTAQIPDDTNLAPRVGFAWDVRGDGRSVLRGGAGVFYSWNPTLIAADSVLQNGVNSNSVFLSTFAPIFPTYPDRLPPEFGQLQPPNISFMDPNFENPETYRFSLGYDQSFGSSWRLGAEVTYSESKHRVRNWDVNLDPTPVDFFPDGRPIYGYDPFSGSFARLDPRFNQKIQYTSDVEAEYFSVVLTAFKRLSRNWSLDANYTYAKWNDHDTAETDLINLFPEDHYNLDQDWGPSDLDLRHQAVISGVYTAPYRFTFSFFGRYNSKFPYTALLSGDANQDQFNFDRPGPDPNLGLTSHLGRNSLRGDSFAKLDLRLSKMFTLSGPHELEIMVDVFNVTDNDNFRAFDNIFAFEDFVTGAYFPNPNFGEPTFAAQPRTWQVSARYRF